MGTSTGYSLPTRGNWSTLKGRVTEFGKAPSAGGGPGGVLGSHRDAFGFGQTGRGAGGSRAGSAASRTAVRAASLLGALVADIGRLGRDEALREHGLSNLEGKSVEQIIDMLTDYLVEGNGALEDGILQNAAARFWEEVFADDASFESLDKLATAAGLEACLKHFFECFILEHFLAAHYESLLKSCGSPASADLRLKTIRDWIKTHLEAAMHGRELASVNWNEPEGKTLVREILETAWEVVGTDE